MNKEQIGNTKLLIEVLQDKIAKNEPAEVLNKWFQPCGTYGCVAGDYFLRRYNLTSVKLFNRRGLKDKKLAVLFLQIQLQFFDHFGFYCNSSPFEDPHIDVFGPASNGTLQERLDHVTKQLEALK